MRPVLLRVAIKAFKAVFSEAGIGFGLVHHFATPNQSEFFAVLDFSRLVRIDCSLDIFFLWYVLRGDEGILKGFNTVLDNLCPSLLVTGGCQFRRGDPNVLAYTLIAFAGSN